MENLFNELKTNMNFKVIINTLKYGSHYFIAYNDSEEMNIIKEFVKYNRIFVLIKTDYIDIFDNNNSFVFNYNEIDLSLLFSDYNVIDSYYAKERQILAHHKRTNYLYFYMISNINIKQADVQIYNYHIGKVIIDKTLNYCKFVSEVIVNDMLFFRFSKYEAVFKRKGKNTDIALLIPGIGDFFITFSIVYEYIQNFYDVVYVANKNMGGTYIDSNFRYMVNLCYEKK